MVEAERLRHRMDFELLSIAILNEDYGSALASAFKDLLFNNDQQLIDCVVV